MLSDTTSACQCWKQAPLNGQIYDSQLPQKIFLWLPAEGIYKGWEKCSILQYIVILSRMIMSQCRWVINWNSKTEISLPAATFSLPAAERYRKRLLILCCTGMRTKHTCASCLCLSGDRMAAMASTKPIRPEPTCKLMYGSISSSMKSRGELTRPTQFVRCVELNTSATWLIWETTLRNTTQSWERSCDLLKMPARERSGSFNRTERALQITKSIASFITLDLRPNSVVENVGFRTIVFILDPRHKIPCCRYFTDTAITTLYSETKT